MNERVVFSRNPRRRFSLAELTNRTNEHKVHVFSQEEKIFPRASPLDNFACSKSYCGKRNVERERGDRRALHRARYPRREVVRCGRYIYSGL